jgi:hypothetical protein
MSGLAQRDAVFFDDEPPVCAGSGLHCLGYKRLPSSIEGRRTRSGPSNEIGQRQRDRICAVTRNHTDDFHKTNLFSRGSRQSHGVSAPRSVGGSQFASMMVKTLTVCIMSAGSSLPWHMSGA